MWFILRPSIICNHRSVLTAAPGLVFHLSARCFTVRSVAIERTRTAAKDSFKQELCGRRDAERRAESDVSAHSGEWSSGVWGQKIAGVTALTGRIFPLLRTEKSKHFQHDWLKYILWFMLCVSKVYLLTQQRKICTFVKLYAVPCRQQWWLHHVKEFNLKSTGIKNCSRLVVWMQKCDAARGVSFRVGSERLHYSGTFSKH